MQVRQILRLLIESSQISEWRLASETGVPQSTINAILTGRSREQKDSTLLPLANYFDVTLAQLRGYEPIEGLPEGGRPQNAHPVVGDDAVAGWISESLPKSYFTRFVRSARLRGERCFVYVAKDDSLAPALAQGSMVFVDPDVSRAPARTNQMTIALIEVDGHYALRNEVSDLGVKIYKATAPGYRTVDAGDCRVVGYVVGIPEEDWTESAGPEADPNNS